MTDRFLESGDHVGVRHMRDTAGERSESLIVPGNTNSVSCDVSPEQSMSGENLDHTLSGIELIILENLRSHRGRQWQLKRTSKN